jgi:hypothetical protein
VSLYLTREELGAWLDLAPTSYMAMHRALKRKSVPHDFERGRPPKVLRRVHDAILMGQPVTKPVIRRAAPNFEALR